jgi:hypothetical protein
LWRRLSGFLVHFPFGVDVDGGAMVGFVIVIHAVQRSRCVWASASPLAAVQSSAPLVVLGGDLSLNVFGLLSCEGPP